MPRTAAALIIGNEILTGKIREANLYVLSRELRLLGVDLRRVIVCPDDIETIADDVTTLRTTHDHLFTSGGVGPTPDDVTLPAVARSFDRPLVRSELIEGLIRGYWGEGVTEGHLRMADIPEGARLLSDAEVPWPVITVENVCVLPGVPQIFEKKLRLMRETIGQDVPFVSRALYTTRDEGSLAAILETLNEQHPSVEIGSYPQWKEPEFKVKLTFDGLDPEAVAAALAACAEAIGPDDTVKTD